MKSITIQSLKLVNFKGIRSLIIDSFGKETKVFGDNGTGKTSVFDAFTWLLFGKDSQDRTSFEIKTLDSQNNVIPKIDHEVEATILVDGESVTLKRIFREKWTKKKGSLEAEFTGNETNYEWNGVPMTQRDYNAKISSIVDEKVFKLITSPAAFTSLKWQDQRQVLIDITGNITDEDIAAGNTDYQELLKNLSNKTIEEYQKQIKASIAKSKKELKFIPSRIDEVERGKPESFDFDQLRKDVEARTEIKASLDNQISNKLEAQQEFLNQRSEVQNKIHSLETEISNVQHKHRQQAKDKFANSTSELTSVQSEITQITSEITSSQNGLNTLKSKLNNKNNELSTTKEQINSITEKWVKVNAEEFKMDENECKCPTCNREFDPETIDEKKAEAEQRFDENKQKRLAQINQNGNSLKETKEHLLREVEDLEKRISNGVDHIQNLELKRENLLTQEKMLKEDLPNVTEEGIYKELVSANTELSEMITKVSGLKQNLSEMQPVDISDIKAKREEVEKDIDRLKRMLSNEDQINKVNQRIDELQQEESHLAQTIADYEREQFIIDSFVKDKMDRLEARINERFNMVDFKLFDTQVNGGQVETCQALIDGVPFSDANTASKINAGIDIINTLCNHYQVSAPIFIDNRESVVNLIPSQSQIINLIVSEPDKKLRVETEVEQLQTV